MEFKKASFWQIVKFKIIWLIKIIWFGINYWFDVLIDLI